MMRTCGRCGDVVNMISGIKCPRCDHVAGSQSLGEDWAQFNSNLGRKRVSGSDDQTRPDNTRAPRRRHPLRFEE